MRRAFFCAKRTQEKTSPFGSAFWSDQSCARSSAFQSVFQVVLSFPQMGLPKKVLPAGFLLSTECPEENPREAGFECRLISGFRGQLDHVQASKPLEIELRRTVQAVVSKLEAQHRRRMNHVPWLRPDIAVCRVRSDEETPAARASLEGCRSSCR